MSGGATGDVDTARGPTVPELRAFVVVAEERHFRRAAVRLGMSPPHLSKSIRRLEAKLGHVLLERTPRAVTLTAAGAELLPRARDVLRTMSEARLAMREADEVRAGPFAVGVMCNGFAELTGAVLDAFAAAHPRLRVTLRDVTSDPGGALRSGLVDVALVRPPIIDGDDPRLVVEDVVLEPRAALLSRRHPLAGAARLALAELDDDPWVAAAPGLPEIRDFWTAAAERGGEPARYGAVASTVPEVVRAVGYLGDVITSFPSLLRFFRLPEVVAVPLTDVSPAPMSLVTRTDDGRPVVAGFRAAAIAVGTRMTALVPGARPAPALLATPA